MQIFDLGGRWSLNCVDDNKGIDGHLPGCTYLDMIADGLPNPFWGENEETASALAERTYEYSRAFELPPGFTDDARIQLAISGLDTLCTITLNGTELGKTDNINRIWRFDVKSLLHGGENTISLHFENPYKYIASKQESEPLPSVASHVKGIGHLRKTPCHFGWDWGPVLSPAGVAGYIRLESSDVRIENLRVRQSHAEQAVTLDMSAKLEGAFAAAHAVFTVTAPNGAQEHYPAAIEASGELGSVSCRVVIERPELWWCNGLGGQPLYTVALRILDAGDAEADCTTLRIGLRTVVLDTSEDEWGSQFRFVINGVPIFAKGADWIPSDSFITRRTRDDLKFYIESAKRANMNMLRVWGGGMYESDDFYDLCDQNGILVWQDFIFACAAYPLYDESFLENVHAEVRDNVRRVRHHASLALWCGNNENELLRMLWKKNRRVDESNQEFYHKTLREWTDEEDGDTAYWPGSPSSGSREHKLHSFKPGQIRGDTHLWQVWHGMKSIEAFRGYPTRFCSEFGMESMPSMHTIRTFTDKPDVDWYDPVMMRHQKSRGGNEKIMFYMLAKYRRPESFDDFIYLSQLVQADTVRFATDCWRRNIGRQNGALYWQYNDCWPVASWAGIDYEKQYKAVQYRASHFNKMLCLSNDYYGDRAELYVSNEYPRPFEGRLSWRLCDFGGVEVNAGETDVRVDAVSAARVAVLRYRDVVNRRKKGELVLYATLSGGDVVADEKNWLLTPDRKAALPKAELSVTCRTVGDPDCPEAEVTVRSARFARYVYLRAEGVTAPWSDNFFDIPGGGEKTVTVRLPEGMSAEQFESILKVSSLTDVKPKGGRLADMFTRASMFLKKDNFISWLVFKLL